MRKILLLSLIFSLGGIIAIYYIDTKSSVEEVPIEKIDSSYIGKFIKTSGKVVSVNYVRGNVFLTIYDKKYLNVVIFSNVARFLERYPRRGDRIVVYGNINEYKGKLQIVPRRASDIKVVE